MPCIADSSACNSSSNCGRALLAQRMTIIEREVLFARLAVDGKQAIHERDGAFQLRVGCLGFALHLDGIDESAPGMRPAASVDHTFRADVFFIGDIPIGVEDSAIVFEELLGDLSYLASSRSRRPLPCPARCTARRRRDGSEPFLSGVCTSTCVSSAWM